MIAVWILLETGNQIIHQALGRNFHPPPGGIAIGEIITPLVIGFLGDLALPQRIGRCLPFVQHQQWEAQSAEMLHRKVRNLPVHAVHPGAAHAEVRYGHR